MLGKRVLVTGATGGVGRMTVQLAHASGAHVTALVRDAAASGELMGRLGAAAVAEHLAGEFDVIINGVGGATFGLAIEHLCPRGVVVNIATQDDEEMGGPFSGGMEGDADDSDAPGCVLDYG